MILPTYPRKIPQTSPFTPTKIQKFPNRTVCDSGLFGIFQGAHVEGEILDKHISPMEILSHRIHGMGIYTYI